MKLTTELAAAVGRKLGTEVVSGFGEAIQKIVSQTEPTADAKAELFAEAIGEALSEFSRLAVSVTDEPKSAIEYVFDCVTRGFVRAGINVGVVEVVPPKGEGGMVS